MRDTSMQDEVIAKPTGQGLNVKLVAVIVAAILVLWGLSSLLSPLLSTDKSISVKQLRFAKVSRGDFTRDISVQGRLVAANSPTLFSTSDGIVKYNVKAGDTVKTGQVLAIITSPELTNQLAQEEASYLELELALERQKIENKSDLKDATQAVDIGEVNLESATVALHRAKLSIEQQLISQANYETAQAQFKLATVNLNHAKQNLKYLKEKLTFELKTRKVQFERQLLVLNDVKRQIAELSIRSPIDGLVGNVNARDSDQVANNQALLSVIELNDYEVEINIPEIYADELAPQLRAKININGEQLDGYLAAISPEVTDGQVVGRLRIEADSIGGLRQNQRVSARVFIESKQNVLKIKRGPFLESTGGRFAYVVDGDYAVKRNISVGLRSAGEVEVVSGLNEGDQLVISNVEEFAGQSQIYLLQ